MTKTTDTALARTDYSPAALARLAMSAAARDLADAGSALVPTASDYCREGGEWTRAAASIAADARELLALAVTYERLRGTTWEEIGEALGGITRQAAQERYGAYVSEWTARALRAWLNPAERVRLLGELPDAMVHRLNAWVDRHTSNDSNPDPVGAGLAALTTLSMSGLVIESAALLQKTRRSGDAADELAALELGYARRKVELAERLVEEGAEGAEEMLAESRARLAELEARS